ncbi:MAG: hypothetical protein PHR51_01150 [Patescibacteria group bacterium]|nr:hypothetical protein [Patescibacteria group bacterium]
MKKFLHHLRRNRHYAPHERWLTFGAMLALTIAISGSGWFLFGRPAASATSLEVSDIVLAQTHVPASLETGTEVTITLRDKITTAPARNIWVGLYIENTWQRSEGLTYNAWYSPEPARAFYQTDELGQISFNMKSELAGEIEYQVYVANPDLKNDNKYQKLEKSFTINFE